MRLGGGYRLVQEGVDHDTTLGEESVHPSGHSEGYAIEMNNMSKQGYCPVMDSSIHQSIPSAPPDESVDAFMIKVLCKEKSYEVRGLTEENTIMDLKQKLVTLADIPIERQQLIMKGKMLKPDDKTLKFFSVIDKSVIHLFPKPVATQPPPVAIPVADGSSNSGTVNVTANPLHRNTATTSPVLATQPQNDPYINQTGREVRLWCMILLILSAFTLFNNLSYFGATGNFGKGVLDSIVFILDTLCSAGGIYVASMGMKSLRSLEIEDIRKYVQYLGVLAVCCIVMRIFWVFDVMFAVEAVVKKNEEEQKSETDSSTGGTDNTDGTNSNDPQLDEDSVTSFTIQAAMIAMIIIYAWVSCYVRARRLQRAVQSYHQVSGTGNPAVASQV